MGIPIKIPFNILRESGEGWGNNLSPKHKNGNFNSIFILGLGSLLLLRSNRKRGGGVLKKLHPKGNLNIVNTSVGGH